MTPAADPPCAEAFSNFFEYPLIGQYLDQYHSQPRLFSGQSLDMKNGKRKSCVRSGLQRNRRSGNSPISANIWYLIPFSQLEKYADFCKEKGVSISIRVNPECSTQGDHAIYDPCCVGIRLGVTLANFREDLVEKLDGIHFHTLCEQDSDDLETTLKAVEDKFGESI